MLLLYDNVRDRMKSRRSERIEIMKKEFYYPSKDGLTQIHAIEWVPETEVRGILQIAHGMVEFIDRYDRFATFMASQGFYVVGNDHLGHGKSVTDESQFGYFAKHDGNLCVIGDMQQLREDTQKKYPEVPFFLLGHSMGSFLARQFIEIYGEGLAGAIIMGTGYQPMSLLNLAIGLTAVLKRREAIISAAPWSITWRWVPIMLPSSRHGRSATG